jgi:hypothetical protein
MSKHVTYRGITIDMEAMARENEKTVALGNMKVNAKGDQLGRGGQVTRTADQIARENHRVQTAVVNTGLKGKVPSADGITIDTPKPAKAKPVQPTVTKPKETELPNGDIIAE